MNVFSLALFVPYAVSNGVWVVRRARTVVGSYPSQAEAIQGARRLAAGLCMRMGGPVRIEVQDKDGGWRAVATAAPHSNAA